MAKVRKAIVLMKQVPDLRAAPVAVGADGTISREAAPAITNPADLHALEAALQVADDVVAVSMGPPRADEVLRDAISRGADRGVLLCDRVVAGSDTWATANALAAVIDHLGGADLVLCGLTAIDGETGQVGPEIAARLGLPQATGCEALEVGATGIEARRIVEGGYERLRLPVPALVTVAETGFLPRYPTLPGRRRAAHATIERVTAADVGLGSDQVGLEASPTKVARMVPFDRPGRACRMIDDGFDIDALVSELAVSGAFTGSSSSPVSDVSDLVVPRSDPGAASSTGSAGDAVIWVVGELDGDGQLTRASLELLSKASELAPGLGGGVGAFLAGADLAAATSEAAQYGAHVVFVASDDRLWPYRCQPHARALVDAIRAHGPDAVLFVATTTGRDLAPRVAALLSTGLAADCTDLAVGSWDRRHVHYDALLHQIRPAMAGGVLATCLTPQARPQMATVRPGMFEPLRRPTVATTVAVPVRLPDEDLTVQVVDRTVLQGDVRLADADVIVAGGAGCDGHTWHLVEDLAEAIGGKVAATRGAVEAGLAPRSLQVGQTGATVRPRLYVACGVSGALQHVVGMRAAQTVVAINHDPDAYIFHVADFGVVGDVADVLPQLTNAVAAELRPG